MYRRAVYVFRYLEEILWLYTGKNAETYICTCVHMHREKGNFMYDYIVISWITLSENDIQRMVLRSLFL